MNDLKSQVDFTNVPKHVAVIMDGNGRWAKQQGEERLFGHAKGVESVRSALHTAKELGVQYLTLYAFSTENWSRPQAEVDGLMDILVRSIANEIDELNKNGVRMLTIGDIDGLPPACSSSLKEAIENTKNNTQITLILALNYSAKWELREAIKEIANAVKSGELESESITDELISSHLTTNNIPDPELMIRTSGEHRISNFLLWQLAYAEFYFTDVHWPDFGRDEFIKSVLAYQRRERRFGMVSEQINESE
ncbi:MAG: isoprenyl transferase [Flavobacteriales bacterium]|nr:isoprenyl transferase [Crocinitomicaceae bacterium]NBX79656.1 isoprenyl transferase [Flavobacteriales bacterium]NCA20121.1 isoprenyl transferase [Crocinitomicaceae bacterium]